jgi:tetratricopeptide (TPR) repeat protein
MTKLFNHPGRFSERPRTLPPFLLSLLCGCCSLLPSPGCVAQKGPKEARLASSVEVVRVKLMEPEPLHEMNTGKEYAGWLRELGSKVHQACAAHPGDRDVLLQVTIHPEKDAEVAVAARPPLSEESRAEMRKTLLSGQPPRARFIPMTIRLTVQVGRGCRNEKIPFRPTLRTPSQKERAAYQKLSVAEKLSALRRWSLQRVLPLLAAATTGVSEKFAGVRSLGAGLSSQLETTRLRPPTVDELTVGNHDYWRALLETTGGSQSVPPTIRMFLHAAVGELEQARRQLFLISIFTPESSPMAYLIDELGWRLKLVFAEVDALLRLGTNHHDEGEYAEAIKTYRQIIRDFPRYALAHYELYFSQKLMKGTKTGKGLSEMADGWKEKRDEIFDYDPLFSTVPTASTAEQAYRMMRRLELRSLFSKPKRLKKDIIELADIATDLSVYGSAAHAYYLAYRRFPAEDQRGRDLLACFLFCMEKLGHTRIKRYFEASDIEARIRKVGELRRERMKRSVVYRSFAKKKAEKPRPAERPPRQSSPRQSSPRQSSPRQKKTPK